ncbi:hypothetical protein GF373_00035 [bacterium]|nr:hypothetical protein [bacterium]
MYDPNRDKGEMPLNSSIATPVDPLAFCVGPVQVKYGGSAKNNRVHPQLDTLIDKENKTLTSVTGQIQTDYGKGIYTVNAAKCQGAAGFLAEEAEIQLNDVTLHPRNKYGSIVVVPLDGRPLAESKHVLVQAGTVARPAGWIVHERAVEADGAMHEGYQIMRKGGEPVLVENINADLIIQNSRLRKATALDVNGQAMDIEVVCKRSDGRLHVTLPPNTLYTILSAE